MISCEISEILFPSYYIYLFVIINIYKYNNYYYYYIQFSFLSHHYIGFAFLLYLWNIFERSILEI